MLLILISTFFFHFCLSAEINAPICVGVTFSTHWTNSDTNADLFHFQFDIDAYHNTNNKTFPNEISFKSLKYWSSNNSTYYMSFPFNFVYWNPPAKFPQWDITMDNISKSFQIPNGLFYLLFDFSTTTDNQIYLSIENGEIFDDYNQLLDSETNPCILNAIMSITKGILINQSICCNHFIDTLSKTSEDICELFESNTVIKDAVGKDVATLKANFQLNNDRLIVVMENFTSVPTVESYKLGSIYNPYLTCNGRHSELNTECRFEISKNIYFDFFLSFGNYYTSIGKLIRRYGVVMKEDSNPFTISDPCSNKNLIISYENGSTAQNKFCCKKFKGQSAPSTPLLSTIPITTVTPSNSKQCLQYRSRTTVSNDNPTYLEIEYKLNSTVLAVNILNYFGFKDSTVQLEAYSPFVWGQTCSATTSNSGNLCYLKLLQNFNYELQMRTSTMPEGFNMLSIAGGNGKLTLPFLNPSNPCHTETNPYNYPNSNKTATTEFCCTSFV